MRTILPKKRIKRKMCNHDNCMCITNFYGDAINKVSTYNTINRSEWKCLDCGVKFLSEKLDANCNNINYKSIDEY